MREIDKIIERLNKDFESHSFTCDELVIVMDGEYNLKINLSDGFYDDLKVHTASAADGLFYDIIKESIEEQIKELEEKRNGS